MPGDRWERVRRWITPDGTGLWPEAALADALLLDALRREHEALVKIAEAARGAVATWDASGEEPPDVGDAYRGIEDMRIALAAYDAAKAGGEHG